MDANQTPHDLLPKLFGELRTRYASRPGGYTRVLRIEPIKEDQAPSAILELVDGPRDMRFAMTARTVARLEDEGKDLNEMTRRNVEKVTRFREGGEGSLREMVGVMRGLGKGDRGGVVKKKEIYPVSERVREERDEGKARKKKPNFFLN